MAVTENFTMDELDAHYDQDTEKKRANYVRNRKVYADCSKGFIGAIKRQRASGAKTHEKIWNACLYINTVGHDLLVSVEQFLFEREDDWRRRLALRNCVLIVYEAADDLGPVLGKDFRESCLTLKVPEDLMTDFNAKKRNVSLFKTSYEASFKEIRTIAGAHRDHDAMLIHETVENLDAPQVFRQVIEFGTLLNELGRATQNILTFTSGVRPPEATA